MIPHLLGQMLLGRFITRMLLTCRSKVFVTSDRAEQCGQPEPPPRALWQHKITRGGTGYRWRYPTRIASMNQPEGKASENIETMVQRLHEPQHETLLRLLACSAASRVLPLLREPAFAKALEASRRFATHGCEEATLAEFVVKAAGLLDPYVASPSVRDYAGSAVVDAASVYPATPQKTLAALTCAANAIAIDAAFTAPDDRYDEVVRSAYEREMEAYCELLHELLASNPNQRITKR